MKISEKNKKNYLEKIVVFLTTATVGLFIVQMVLSGNISALNKEVGTLDTKIGQLRKENDFLTQKVSQISSLIMIEEKAYALGFSKNYLVQDYSSVNPVALLEH